jgi:hypothetical protein
MDQDTVRESLYKQLKNHGADITLFHELVEDYCYYDALEKEMQKNVKEMGFQFEGISATGKAYTKNNPCVIDAVKYNAQKLKILQQLKLNVTNVIKDDKADEDENDL